MTRFGLAVVVIAACFVLAWASTLLDDWRAVRAAERDARQSELRAQSIMVHSHDKRR
jgi:hypothetical protein